MASPHNWQAAASTVMQPALALIEFSSIAVGMLAGDAMVKKAPVARVVAGTVHPGKYLVMIAGEVAEVEESLAAGQEVGGSAVIDIVLLPHVHPGVVEAILGERDVTPNTSLGIIETATVAAAIHAADAGLKGAEVRLLEIRLADGLHGKGLTLFTGEVSDVEAALEIGLKALESPDLLVQYVIIPQLHPEMGANILTATRFRSCL